MRLVGTTEGAGNRNNNRSSYLYIVMVTDAIHHIDSASCLLQTIVSYFFDQFSSM